MPREQKNGSGDGSRRRGGEARDGAARKAATKTASTRRAKTSDATSRKLKALPVAVPRAAVANSPDSAQAAISNSISRKRPSVAIVGAGRLGRALALALAEGGYRVLALVARNASHARSAARSFPRTQPLALGASALTSLPDTDLVLVTTPDDQIAEVAARLAGVFAARREIEKARAARRPRVALHASGALSSGALAPLGEHAFSLGSLHPLVSVSGDARRGALNLRGAFYCLEGETRALGEARRIVRTLDGQSFSVAARDKPLYHASAVIASGHGVALFSLAASLLARCGLSESRARQVLLPLVASTLDNLRRARVTAEALTGTFARADLATVRKHLVALEEADATDALVLYALLGERSLQLAARRRPLDAATTAEITRLLHRALAPTPSE